jgi:hypothetical protein
MVANYEAEIQARYFQMKSMSLFIKFGYSGTGRNMQRFELDIHIVADCRQNGIRFPTMLSLVVTL